MTQHKILWQAWVGMYIQDFSGVAVRWLKIFLAIFARNSQNILKKLVAAATLSRPTRVGQDTLTKLMMLGAAENCAKAVRVGKNVPKFLLTLPSTTLE